LLRCCGAKTVRSQAREPRHDARKQREATSCNEDSNRCNEKATNDAGDARSAAESTQDSLQRSGAAICYRGYGQERECETETVERQKKRSTSRVAPSRRDSEDCSQNHADAGGPCDGKGGTEQQASQMAATFNDCGCAHTVELRNAQKTSKVQATDGHCNANWDLQDWEESASGASDVARANAEGDEDHAKATGEE